MKLNLKIQQKIQLFIIGSSILIYTIILGYITINARESAYNDAIDKTNSYAQEVAKDIKARLDADLASVVSLTNAVKIYKDFSKEEWQELVHKMYLNVFKNNKRVYALCQVGS